MYKPGNVSRPPPVVVPHQPRLDWQMWFAALGPHTHSPWFTSLVLRLLQGKDPGEAWWGVAGWGAPGKVGGSRRRRVCGKGRLGLWSSGRAESCSLAVVRLIQNDVAKYPFHKQPPTYVQAQRYKYWFSQPGEQR